MMGSAEVMFLIPRQSRVPVEARHRAPLQEENAEHAWQQGGNCQQYQEHKVIIDTNGQDGEEVKEPAPEEFPAQTERVLQRDISVTKELN